MKINNNLLKDVRGTILYSNSTGTTSNVPLNEIYTNYKYIKIFGKKDGYQATTEFDTTVGSAASLTISRRTTSSTITFYTNVLTFSGTNATVEGGAIAFTSSSFAGFTNSNEIYITKIIGYN